MTATLLDLTKSLELNLQKAEIYTVPVMAVKLLVDRSGSMSSEFASGWVQSTIDLFLAAAMKFDDDGVMQIGFFNTRFIETPEVTESDAGKYINANGIFADGGTSFAEGLRKFKYSSEDVVEEKRGFLSSIFSRKANQKSAEKPTPVYIAMITDGENSDKRDFETQLASLENTFVQIVGIGTGVDQKYLNAVASRYENVSVLYLPNPKTVTADSFYDKLLNDDLKKFI